MAMTIGIAGAGKSRFRTMHKDYCRFMVISKDDIRFSILNYNRSNIDFLEDIEPLIKEIEKLMFLELIKKNYNIFLDGTHLTAENRKFFLEYAKNNDYNIHLIVFDNIKKAKIYNNERLRRVPSEVINRQISSLEYPNSNELKLITKLEYVR